jgi:outer membrane protein OmpA-like peptidoglycan-associated protein
MSVALLAVTKTVTDRERQKTAYDTEVEALLTEVQSAVDRYPGVTLDRERRLIDFGSRANFQFRDYRIAPDKARYLRSFVPDILSIAESEHGKHLLKQVVVEGFTDETGTYLYNLHLSLQRSESVLCALLAEPASDEKVLSATQRHEIVDLFLVSGFAFNSARATADDSRRVELRLELYAFGETAVPPVTRSSQELGKCAVS